MRIATPRDTILAAQLACCLELSATPKPGCVDRFSDFRKTTFQHFIAGCIVMGSELGEASAHSYEMGRKHEPLRRIEIGRWIRRCASSVKKVQHGGNTHMGTILLYTPLVCSAAYLLPESRLDELLLQRTVRDLMEATTAEDAVNVYKAIRISGVGGLGRIQSATVPDVNDADYSARLRRDKLSLLRVMEASKGWDRVASELASGMEIGFSIGARELTKLLDEGYDLNTAMVHTFLKIMAKFPDTLISRKLRYEQGKSSREAVNISSKYSLQAQEVLDYGGIETEKGIKMLLKLDRDLRRRRLSPGTTADLLAESILIVLLSRGYPMVP